MNSEPPGPAVFPFHHARLYDVRVHTIVSNDYRKQAVRERGKPTALPMINKTCIGLDVMDYDIVRPLFVDCHEPFAPFLCEILPTHVYHKQIAAHSPKEIGGVMMVMYICVMAPRIAKIILTRGHIYAVRNLLCILF